MAQRPLSRTDTIALRSRAIEAACAFYSENYTPPMHELAERIAFFELVLMEGADAAVAEYPKPVDAVTKLAAKFNVVS
jgi:hypothetical protein